MPSQKRGYVDLGKDVADKSILDRNDRYVGKVDDLVLEMGDQADGAPEPPEVVAIVTGPTALASHLPGIVLTLARAFYRLVGLPDPKPVEIPWQDVSALHVVVRVDLRREEIGALALADAVDRSIISRLPGAGTRP